MVASRTTRDLHYDWSFTGNYEQLTPNFTTTNTAWQGLFATEFSALKACYYDELNTHKQSGWGWWPFVYCDQNGLYSFAVTNHSDPDTGRSPLNVNTCEISGNPMPVYANNSWAWPLEGVFNIESLARIIKVGKILVHGTRWIDMAA